ncbi:YbaY family lipoprotein [Rhizobium leguminosarum]|uniref:YbaY family lipoprotein n=1 Tax=Rhizobium leguminosarum TaxID=384 RepID=UPI003F981F77
MTPLEIAGTIDILAPQRNAPLLVRVRLEDTTMMDAPSLTVAETAYQLEPGADLPVPFSLSVSDDAIDRRHAYTLSARAGFVGEGEPARYGTVESYPWSLDDNKPSRLELRRLN